MCGSENIHTPTVEGISCRTSPTLRIFHFSKDAVTPFPPISLEIPKNVEHPPISPGNYILQSKQQTRGHVSIVRYLFSWRYLVLVCFQSTIRKKGNLLWQQLLKTSERRTKVGKWHLLYEVSQLIPYHLDVNFTSNPTSPPEFPGPLNPPPHPPGISNSLHGGNMDIFWNHTICSCLP